MPKRRIVVGVLATACCISPALAQTSTAPATGNPPAPVTRDQGMPNARPGPFLTQPNQYVRGSKLIGVEVIGADITRIGQIEDILVDSAGRLAGVVIGVGGFLGIGEKRVAVPYDLLLWNYGDVSRDTTQSASVTTPAAPGNAPPSEQNAAKMPGANISNDVVAAPDLRPGGAVTPATGPVTSEAAKGETATAPVGGIRGEPVRAVVRLSKAELQNAPEFRADRRDRGDAPGAGPSAGGSSGTTQR